MSFHACYMCGRQGKYESLWCPKCDSVICSVYEEEYMFVNTFLTRQFSDFNVHNRLRMRWEQPLFIIGLISGYMNPIMIIQVLIAFQYVESPEYLLSLIRFYNKNAYKRMHDLLFSISRESMSDYICCNIPSCLGFTCTLDLKTLKKSNIQKYTYFDYKLFRFIPVYQWSCSCTCGCSTFTVSSQDSCDSKWEVDGLDKGLFNDRQTLVGIIQNKAHRNYLVIMSKLVDEDDEAIYIPRLQKERRITTNAKKGTNRCQRKTRKPVKSSYGPGKNKSKRDIILV